MGFDWKKWFRKEKDGQKKDWFSIFFPIMLICAVIILMMTNTNRNIPDTAESESSEQEVRSQDQDAYAAMLEEKLADAFSRMAGVGEVRVYVTLAGSGEETVLKDEGRTAENVQEEDSGAIRSSERTEEEETTVTDSEGNPYVVSATYPNPDRSPRCGICGCSGTAHAGCFHVAGTVLSRDPGSNISVIGG